MVPAARPVRTPLCSAVGTTTGRAGTALLCGAPRRPATNRRSPARARAIPRARRSLSRTMHAPSRFGLAIPPAIRELLAEQPDHNAVDVQPEIGADRDGTPIDARLHLTVEEPLPGVLPTAGRTHQRDHLTHRLGLRIDAEIPGATSGWAASRSRAGPWRSRRGNPPGSTHHPPTGRPRRAVRAIARPTPASRREPAPRTPPAGVCVSQVTQYLSAQRRIGVEQPVQDSHPPKIDPEADSCGGSDRAAALRPKSVSTCRKHWATAHYAHRLRANMLSSTAGPGRGCVPECCVVQDRGLRYTTTKERRRSIGGSPAFLEWRGWACGRYRPHATAPSGRAPGHGSCLEFARRTGRPGFDRSHPRG